MADLIINIDWVYFLGIVSALIGVAWYSGSRFTKVETDISWLKEILNSLKINSDNKDIKAFERHSPVSLTLTGKELLSGSGLKEYIDLNTDKLCKDCEDTKGSNPYEVQQYIFKMFAHIKFPKNVEDTLKRFAFEKGTSEDILRRIGAIYFRDICLKKFDLSIDEIDNHTPSN